MRKLLPPSLALTVDSGDLSAFIALVHRAATTSPSESEHQLTIGALKPKNDHQLYHISVRATFLTAATHLPLLFGITSQIQAVTNLGCLALGVILSLKDNIHQLSEEEGALFFVVYSSPSRLVPLRRARSEYLRLCKGEGRLKPEAFGSALKALEDLACVQVTEENIVLIDPVVIKRFDRPASTS